MINETLLIGGILSTVLGLAVFHVCWRHLSVIIHDLSGLSFIYSTGGTMHGPVYFNSTSMGYWPVRVLEYDGEIQILNNTIFIFNMTKNKWIRIVGP